MTSVSVIDSNTLESVLSNHKEAIELLRNLAAENNGLKKKVYLSSQEVAEMTGYNEKTIRLKKDEIGYYDNNGQLRFHRNDVEKWMNRHYIRPKK